jgi:dTMP kinase
VRDHEAARGRFIVFEGGEGVGKSTQARLLANALRATGLAVDLTREPGGTPGAEAIRALLLDAGGSDWGPKAEALLFAAARSDHVEKLIMPALETGRWVVCDRFVDSSRAYQGAAGAMCDDDILALHRIGSAGLLPDLTIVLRLEPQATRTRLRARDGDASDRIGGRAPEYHAAVASAFEGFAAAEPARFVIVEASGEAEEVHGRVMIALKRFEHGR